MTPTSHPPELVIVPFNEEHQQAFYELNRAWLEAYFLLESYDLKVLRHPKETVLNQGGAIFFGLLDGEVVATFALTPVRLGVVELNKMAVRKDCQSQGLGQQLMEFLLAECRRRDIHTIELFSHSKLAPALHIYRKFGFEPVPMPASCHYDRADVHMRLIMNSEALGKA